MTKRLLIVTVCLWSSLAANLQVPTLVNGTTYTLRTPHGEMTFVFTAYGGYHDAGDADRRTYHMDVPVTLMTTYEAFPQLFTDDQFNIPDKFDENYHILGKGNGIPDILDEAMWGTMFWEYMQETNGQIHWGTETKGYSPFTTYEKDPNAQDALRGLLRTIRQGGFPICGYQAAHNGTAPQ